MVAWWNCSLLFVRAEAWLDCWCFVLGHGYRRVRCENHGKLCHRQTRFLGIVQGGGGGILLVVGVYGEFRLHGDCDVGGVR